MDYQFKFDLNLNQMTFIKALLDMVVEGDKRAKIELQLPRCIQEPILMTSGTHISD